MWTDKIESRDGTLDHSSPIAAVDAGGLIEQSLVHIYISLPIN